jgi:FkbH-like protein
MTSPLLNGTAGNATTGAAAPAASASTVKCLVWDLDGTVWNGVLLEDGADTLLPGVRETIEELDRRGILHSVASKNEPGPALARLEELGLAGYFLHPQISWGPKSAAVARIAQALNIGIDAVALIDDQEFERDEVRSVHPAVRCLDAALAAGLPGQPEFSPRFITTESARRREMYLSAIARDQAEKDSGGPSPEFLAGLDMVFTITPAASEHLRRAEELTVRTHQLNSTGRTYSQEELDKLTRSPDHLVLVAELTDKYGSYGTIGLALVEKASTEWQIKLLLMSCRVMSRGVGTVLLNHLQAKAHAAGVTLRADFVPTDRNRIMYVTYRFAGFTEISQSEDGVILESTPASPPPPAHLTVVARD